MADFKFKEISKDILTKPTIDTKGFIEPAKFISYLFSCRTVIHILHLKTNSFGTHRALNTLYDELLEITDSIAEKTSGCMGSHLSGFKDFPVAEYENNDPYTYVKEVKDYVERDRYYHFPKENTAIQNILDELVGLLDESLYLLSLK